MKKLKVESSDSREPVAAGCTTELTEWPGYSSAVAIIDDDPSVRRAMSRLLEANGFRCVAFASAEDYLAYECPECFSCLILDVQLGGMTGPQLCAELARADTSTAVIFLTASDDGTADYSVLAGEANAILQKPVDVELLGNALNAHCIGDNQMREIPQHSPAHQAHRSEKRTVTHLV